MWVGIPVTMLVATGIIMNLPQDQIEAAEIDGASKFQIFKSITSLFMFMQNYYVEGITGGSVK